MSIAGDLLKAGNDVLMGTHGQDWSADGSAIVYQGRFADRHGNNLDLAGILPETTGVGEVHYADYLAAGLAVGRRITRLKPKPREFVIIAEEVETFGVTLQLASPDQ